MTEEQESDIWLTEARIKFDRINDKDFRSALYAMLGYIMAKEFERDQEAKND